MRTPGPEGRARLTRPLVRDSHDEPLRAATWDEALTRAAEGPSRARGAFGTVAGTRATTETHYAARKFARVVRGPDHVDSRDRTRHTPRVAGLPAALGPGRAAGSSGTCRTMRA
ncbi:MULTISPECIES: molybdopterin-dependent oxidoreductase [unclassified Streptomyces]|uniref:molybdopterin-dependent oxidoreductase n=1 Tax=unclassified Streptomyces TaxID=2593676 RepID=UPI002E8188E8|nr:molybdopterin-dependent oxidoreductase [Streptomyces sp. NBC_00589]